MKAIVFDSSTLINFAINGMLSEFRELKKLFDGKFLITKEVVAEIIDKPIRIKRFELEALKLKELITDKVLEMPSSLGIEENKISKTAGEIMNAANNAFFANGNPMNLIHSGEASGLALSKLLTEKGIQNVMSVDERTMRLIVEKPENLLAIFQKKFHTDLKLRKESLKSLGNFKFIRSTELIFIAYKKGIIKLRNHGTVLDALLYAMKLNGCSISDQEIEEMKRL